jgi:TRAP-type C4-dicarboxylate transport system permease small subunit
MKRMLALLDVVQRVEAALVSTSILGIAAMSAANVFTRTVLGFSLAWAQELSQFLMITVTFVGLSYAASQGRHIRMTAIYDQLPRSARKALMVAIAGITSALLGILAVFGVAYAVTLHTLGTVSPALQVPLWIVYAVAPVGFGLGALQYALTVVRNLGDEGIFIAPDVPDEYEDAVVPGI